MSKKLGCIILAAGMGSRMNSNIAKPLHKVANLSMVGHVIKNAEKLDPEKIVVVIGNGMEDMKKEVSPHATVIQEVANGTGGAVLAAKEHFKDFAGDILILYGDSPLVSTLTMEKMVETIRKYPGIGLSFSGMRPADPARYGRMIKNSDGTLDRIVEYKDATEKEREITLCNGGIVCADASQLFSWLEKIDNNNAQNEYNLTDLPAIAGKDHRMTHVVEVPVEEMAGANSRQELANLEHLMQKQLREKHMINGATLVAPETVYFSHDTIIGQDVVIEPDVFFGLGVEIADNVHVRAFSHLEGAKIDQGTEIGPFARVREGSDIGRNAVVGNFVEMKNSVLKDGVKAKHLSYLGNTTIGSNSNIGAGTITCNYDGYKKHNTNIGDNVFIGSNSSLIAPINIADGAIIAAGSTITEDVAEGALGITRANQNSVKDFADKHKEKNKS